MLRRKNVLRALECRVLKILERWIGLVLDQHRKRDAFVRILNVGVISNAYFNAGLRR